VWPRTASWRDLRDYLGAHDPFSPVIKLCVCHPRKKGCSGSRSFCVSLHQRTPPGPATAWNSRIKFGRFRNVEKKENALELLLFFLEKQSDSNPKKNSILMSNLGVCLAQEWPPTFMVVQRLGGFAPPKTERKKERNSWKGQARGWKRTKDCTIFGTKNRCCNAKWPNSQSNFTHIQRSARYFQGVCQCAQSETMTWQWLWLWRSSHPCQKTKDTCAASRMFRAL